MSPTGQRQSNSRTQQKKLIVPILFLYYEENLVSSNLNSKLLRFHPNLQPHGRFQLVDLIITELKDHMICYNSSMPLIG